jgi:hypothetical protein
LRGEFFLKKKYLFDFKKTMPRSRSRTHRRVGKRSRTRVGGIEDNGTAALYEFLRPYTRIALDDKCQYEMVKPKLFVWHSEGNRWSQMPQDKVDDLWNHNKQDVKKLCKELNDNMFELYPHMENTFKRALKDVNSRDVAGLYTDGRDFVVVVRTPDEIFSTHGQALGMSSFLAGGVGGYLAGSALPKAFDVVTSRLKKEEDEANKTAIDAEVLKLITLMGEVGLDEQKKVASDEQKAASKEPDDGSTFRRSTLLLGLQKLDTWHNKDVFERVYKKVYPDGQPTASDDA